MQSPNFAAEAAARRAIAQAAQQNVDLIFRGARLVLNYDRRKEFRSAAIADLKDAVSNGSDIARTAASGVIPDARQAILGMLREMLPGVAEIEEAVEDLLPDLLGELAAAVPYVGPCISMAKGSTNLVLAARDTFHRVQVGQHVQVVTPGSPRRAVDAMATVLERRIANEVLVGTRHLAAGSAEIAVTAASFGADYASPIIGTANALLSFAHNVYLHILDRNEMKEANLVLSQQEPIGPRVFDTSPILGCFYVGMVSTSDLIAGISVTIGSSDNWMSDTEKLIKDHIHPLQRRATALIQGSRFYLETPAEGLHGIRGTGLMSSVHNKATLRPIDGPMTGVVNLALNKRYNFGRQVSQVKHTVRQGRTNMARSGAARALRAIGAGSLARRIAPKG